MPTSTVKSLQFDPFRFCASPLPTPLERQRLIAESAYFRAQKRGFAPGHETSDWRAAEVEVDALIVDRRFELGLPGGS